MRNLEPIPNALGPVPPRLNGRYAVTRLLGKGAQARVYLAWDSRLKQWRALKVLAQAHLDDEHIKSRFDGEAQMMAKLSHLNLLRVLDVAADGHIPFMVMELARGGSIVDWMKRNGALPPRMAVDVAMIPRIKKITLFRNHTEKLMIFWVSHGRPSSEPNCRNMSWKVGMTFQSRRATTSTATTKIAIG